jgi:hypothetical protein
MKEENGPLIALVVFILLSAIFGYKAYDHYKSVVGDEQNPPMDKKIREHKEKIESIKADIKKANDDIVNLTRSIKEQQDEYSYQEMLFGEYTQEQKRRENLLTVAEKFTGQADELNTKIDKVKNDTLTRVTSEITDVRDRMEREIQVLTADREASLGRQRVLHEEFDTDNKKYRASRNYEQSTLDESKSILTDLTQRDPEHAEVLTEVDGKVVLSDVVHNLVIIDIGTDVGVKNGYRFEVYQMRPGNRKIIKGYIEVKKADVSKSECLLVTRPVALPRDPLSDYVATMPEEGFSPKQESGKKGSSAQPLSGKPKLVVLGNDPKDPIVEGDLIQNPFFNTKKTLSFYIAGSKEIANDRQKSAIRYKWTEIKAVIEAYGGKVFAQPDVGCDYMVAQKSPSEGTDAERDEFTRAKDLGIPVVYEWELFRFLENK